MSIRDTSGGIEKDRSAGDRERHRKLVHDKIKFRDLIAEESIIGKDRDKIVRVPIRGIKEYRFVYGENKPGTAQGDGNSQPGRVVGQQQGQGEQGKEKAGDQPGIDYYETEVRLGDLLDMMFADLKLPDLVAKALRLLISERDTKHKGYRHVGIRVRLAKRESIVEYLKRKIASGFLEFEKNFPKEVSEEEYETLLTAHAKHPDILYKIEAWYYPKSDKAGYELRFPKSDDDLKYRHMEPKEKEESNAVVICIMDTSGSMETMKKYLARSFFFLLHAFVERRYRNTEVVFIAHAIEGHEVTEEEFFHKGESGGTFISSGYNKAIEVIRDRFHPTLWNVYAIHCSDGDNFESDNPAAIKAAKELCELCNLFGYVEIKPTGARSYESSMQDLWGKTLSDIDNWGMASVKGEDDVYPALKKVLKKAKTDVMTEEKEVA